MTVLFNLAKPPAGYRLGCAWDDRVFATYAEAREAAKAHPADGCPAGKQFYASIANLPDKERFAAENDVFDRTGRWAEACVDLMPMWVDEVLDGDYDRVQMSNDNAAAVLRALGFTSGHDVVGECEESVESLADILNASCPEDVQWSGTVDPDDLLARIHIADALVPDEGVVASSTTVGGSVVINQGRPAGYIRSRLGQLAELALAAKRANARVGWS